MRYTPKHNAHHQPPPPQFHKAQPPYHQFLAAIITDNEVQYCNLLLLTAKSDRCAELLAWSDVTASVISRYWRHISSALPSGSLFRPTPHKPPTVTPSLFKRLLLAQSGARREIKIWFIQTMASLYRVIHKSVKHFKNSQQIDYATDHGISYADRERNSPSFFFKHIS